MRCLSLELIENWIIWLIVVCAVVAVIKLLLPLITPALGGWAGLVVKILWIVLYAIIAIFVVIVCFDLLSCVIGSMPSLRGR